MAEGDSLKDILIDIFQGGDSSGFWTTDAQRAASYDTLGQGVRRAQVPQSVFDAGREAAMKHGQPGPMDTFLPDVAGKVDPSIKAKILELVDEGPIDLNKAAMEAADELGNKSQGSMGGNAFKGLSGLKGILGGTLAGNAMTNTMNNVMDTKLQRGESPDLMGKLKEGFSGENLKGDLMGLLGIAMKDQQPQQEVVGQPATESHGIKQLMEYLNKTKEQILNGSTGELRSPTEDTMIRG